MPDKFSATWISYSRLKDFQTCPRAFYLKNLYKDPQTGRKLQLMTPALALGQVVHQVLESLSKLKAKDRFKVSLIKRLDQLWPNIAGKKGGFSSLSQEQAYRRRGEKMLQKVMDDPGPLANLAIKIKHDLPQFWLSEADEIILTGKIDWLEYLPDLDAVHIIDFKTSRRIKEAKDSLQLPIYYLLVKNTQHRQVAKISYWYLDIDSKPSERQLPDLDKAKEEILTLAKKIKTATKLGEAAFKCPHGAEGCYACRPFEAILRGEAELVGQGQYGKDVYILPNQDELGDVELNSEII